MDLRGWKVWPPFRPSFSLEERKLGLPAVGQRANFLFLNLILFQDKIHASSKDFFYRFFLEIF